MSITSFLSEGEKTCSLRSRKEATATGRQCLRPTESAGYKRFLPCVCRNKAICASLRGVSKVTGKRDSSIIQITAADVNPLFAKKTICPAIPLPKVFLSVFRSRKEATATGRQCLHPTESAGYKRFLPCVCRNKTICASLLGVSKAARNRDSYTIQITAADVNPLSAKKTIRPAIPLRNRKTSLRGNRRRSL